jgi:hypothetical protein
MRYNKKLRLNMRKLFFIIGIIVLVLAVAFIYHMNTKSTDKAVQSESSLGTANQIRMKVVLVDENANIEYATIWLTPSARIYKLVKNVPEYKEYLDLMKQSEKEGSLLTFTLDTEDSSIIKSINK